MAFKLICVHPFHGYAKGQEITDQAEVARLMQDRDHHFVRVAMSEPRVEAEAVKAEAVKAKK